MSLLQKLTVIQRSVEKLLRINGIPIVKVQKRVKQRGLSETREQKAISAPHDFLGFRIIEFK